jgi:hypothetical protein
MRRILFAVLVSSALVAALPATALARHAHRSHHHANHRKPRIRHETFGSNDTAVSGSTSSPNEQNAGTVALFKNGTLTLAVGNSSVSGAVTNGTRLECRAPETGNTEAARDRGDDHGGSSSGDEGSPSSDDPTSTSDQSESTNSGDDQAEAGDDQAEAGNDNAEPADNNDEAGENQGEQQPQACDMSSLKQGTTVREAELEITPAGAVWQKVELITL